MKFRNVTTEVEENVEVESELIDKIVKHFIKTESLHQDYHYLKKFRQSKDLTPARINILLNKLVNSTQKNINLENSLYFIKNEIVQYLIQDSYNLGYNDFNLIFNISDLYIDNLKGKEEDPLKLNISVKSIYSLGQYSENVQYTTDSIVGIIGGECKNCIFTLLKSTPYVHDNVNDCIIRVPNEKSFNLYLENINLNTTDIQLIDKKANIIKENYEI